MNYYLTTYYSRRLKRLSKQVNPLPMVYRPPYPWYIDTLRHPTHGISTPYSWYIDPPAHGISTPLPMVYQSLSYGIMNSSLLVEMRGVQFTMRGFKIQWQKIDPGIKIPYGKLNPGSIYHGVQNTIWHLFIFSEKFYEKVLSGYQYGIFTHILQK